MTLRHPEVTRQEQVVPILLIIEIKRKIAGNFIKHAAFVNDMLRKRSMAGEISAIRLFNIVERVGIGLGDVVVIAVLSHNLQGFSLIRIKAGAVVLAVEQGEDSGGEFFGFGGFHVGGGLRIEVSHT